jgi:hypothetical protein
MPNFKSQICTSRKKCMIAQESYDDKGIKLNKQESWVKDRLEI